MKVTLFAGRAKALLAVAAMLLGVFALAITTASPARAATLSVTSNADSGPGTLREAVATANANGEPDTITFDLPRGQRTITLASQITFSVLQATTVDGAGQGVTVSGGNVGRAFDVLPTAGLTVKNLTVVGGKVVDFGGGIRNLGTLTVTGSTFSGNSAGFGGGIYNNGTATVTDSTFSGNTAVASLVGNGFGGGMDNRGVATVRSSTFSGNSADRNGGGFRNGNIATITNSTFSRNSADLLGGGTANNGVTETVVNSTFSGNSAGIAGGGVSNLESPGTATLRNSIVANSVSGGDCAAAAGVAAVNDGGYNISTDATCGFSAAKNSRSGTDPRLSPAGLADNGGPTQTIALEKRSPAVDAIPVGTNGCGTEVDKDQRGVQRPQGKGCDIGAVESTDRACPTPGKGHHDEGGKAEHDEKAEGGHHDDGHHDASGGDEDPGHKPGGNKDHEPGRAGGCR